MSRSSGIEIWIGSTSAETFCPPKTSRKRKPVRPRREDRDRQTDEYLIDPHRDRQESEEQRQHQPGGNGGSHPRRQTLGLVGRPESEEAAGEHHPLDPEVEQPGPLRHRLAECGQDEWHGPEESGREHRRDEVGQVDAVHRDGPHPRPLPHRWGRGDDGFDFLVRLAVPTGGVEAF